MKAVILAGGLGSRLSEETVMRPKPMVEIGGKPIIWHIMKMYYHQGITEFIICCGYKGYVLKEYFANYRLYGSDVTINASENCIDFDMNKSEAWTVTLAETGELTMTGGRLKRVREYLVDEEMFCLTYGDGVSSVDIKALINFHRSHDGAATITAVRPPSRFGVLDMDETKVRRFTEKPVGEEAYINGGFFVLGQDVFNLIDGDDTVWERSPLECLASAGQLHAYRHDGFWQPMDTLRDRNMLEELWNTGQAPWKCWI